MPNIIEGVYDGKGRKFGIVVSRWNQFVVSKLVDGALDGFARHGVNLDDVDIAYCPGSFEIPLMVKKMADTRKYDAVLAIGAVIRGSTPHFDYIASETTKGVAHVGLESGVPCIFGVLTTDSIEQAIERAGSKAGNKGFEAAMSALEMASVLSKI